MCLYSQNIKPFKAKRDIVVYKLLERKAGGRIVTPCQETEVELGKVFKAEGELPKLPENYLNNCVCGGVIHAYIDEETIKNHDGTFVKGIVKAGTPFFVQFDMEEIAAAEILLDDHFINNESESVSVNLKEIHSTIYDIMREEYANSNGVKVGDYVLSDKTFVSPDKLTDNMDVIGIVSFFYNDGRAHITALKQSKLEWSDNKTIDNKIDEYEDVYNDFNGKIYTERLANKHEKSISEYPALKFCVDYETNGTDKGDWFFDSTGELVQTIRNIYLINVSVKKLREIKGDDYADYIELYNWYWALAEDSQYCAWGCDTSSAHVNFSGKWYTGWVRPAFAIG